MGEGATYLDIVSKPPHETQKCFVRRCRVVLDEEGGEGQSQQLPVLVHETNERSKRRLLGIFFPGELAQTHVETDRGLVVGSQDHTDIGAQQDVVGQRQAVGQASAGASNHLSEVQVQRIRYRYEVYSLCDVMWPLKTCTEFRNLKSYEK